MLCTLQDDLRKVYEGLMKDVNIRVIELQDHVLSMYDRQISNYTQKEFQRCDAHLEPCQSAETCRVLHAQL
jgi:NADH dehydrogenase FAD-containing subunit